jgi:pimeloyl-ACP methyl ester carboxylesterase
MGTITRRHVQTARIETHVYEAGPASGTPVLFVHGNASSAVFWEETLLALPAGFRGIAPDLRGYGDTEDKLIDATRGCQDWADDLVALMDALGAIRFHTVGHSLGGSVLWTLIASVPQRVISATLAAPGSPYGFGGTRGLNGEACAPDFAGSGGGTVNREFARLLGEGYRGTEHANVSPRIVMNAFYWKPPFVPAREEALLSSLLSEKTGDQKYPGDMTPSEHWPMVAPGVYGPINALSPKYVGDSVKRLIAATPKPPVLWLRGADDQIVSDTSLFDLNFLGQLGAVPGWPGAETHPPQPMVGQTRAVLEAYQQHGGEYQEIVLKECGHTPYLEHPEAFNAAFHKLLSRT